MRNELLTSWLLVASVAATARGEIAVPIAPGSFSGAPQAAATCPGFHWGGPPDAREFELAVYRLPAGNADSLETTGGLQPVVRTRLPGSARGWELAADRCLEPGSRYAWSIRAVDGAGGGEWSRPALFEIPSTPSIAEIEAALDVLRRYAADRGRDDGVTPRSLVPPAGRDSSSIESALGEQIGARPGADSARAAGAERAAPVSGAASLILDQQLHLGPNSAVFRDGTLFLWGDSIDQVALGHNALSSNTTGNVNTAIGAHALESNGGGYFNTAVGGWSLSANQTGKRNTALGAFAMTGNTAGNANTAVGDAALFVNGSGSSNTAVGANSLASNQNGNFNTAVGHTALASNQFAGENTAVGHRALEDNRGNRNTAIGQAALANNDLGTNNTGVGEDALFFSTSGNDNTALGEDALKNVKTGSNNIGIGRRAGFQLGTTSDNIMIGTEGSIADDRTIRIGVQGLQLRTRIAGISGIALSGGANVVVESDGRLGVGASSRRFKEQIHEMGDVGDELARLRPVRFRYREEHSGRGRRPLEYGLIAEEVADVLPELVALDAEGAPYAVRYDLLSSLLLEELQRQSAALVHLDSEIERLRKQLRKLTRHRNH